MTRYTLCGVEITEQEVNRIKLSINTSSERLAIEYFKSFYERLRVTLKCNPHNTFKGTPVEYIRTYLPSLVKYLKYV